MNAESLAYCFVRQQERFASAEPKEAMVLRQYEPDFDTFNYVNFNKLTFLNPEIRREEREKLDVYTRFNLNTMLGERFHVLLSERTDIIRDGKLYAPYSQEPMVQMFIRGQEYRKEHGSTQSDQEREAAEVESFLAIESTIADPATPDGTMFLVISQPGKEGTEYLHNFYDIYTKQGDTVDYRRYSSALDASETFAKVLELSPGYARDELNTDPDFVPDDVYFLKHPVRVVPNRVYPSADALHTMLHTDHGSMSKDEFAYLVAGSEAYREAYIQIVGEAPDDILMRNLAYNAYLNKADMLADEIEERKKNRQLIVFEQKQLSQPTRVDLVMLGSQAVREVMTGCGNSGGMSIAEIFNQNPIRDIARSAFGVVDFSVLQLTGDLGYSFDQEGNCVTCGSTGAKVGPCGICELCDRAIRREQGMQTPAIITR